eukprot:gene44778-10201_t
MNKQQQELQKVRSDLKAAEEKLEEGGQQQLELHQLRADLKAAEQKMEE